MSCLTYDLLCNLIESTDKAAVLTGPEASSSPEQKDTAINYLSLATDYPTRLEDSRFVMGSEELADAFHPPLTVRRSFSQHTAVDVVGNAVYRVEQGSTWTSLSTWSTNMLRLCRPEQKLCLADQ